MRNFSSNGTTQITINGKTKCYNGSVSITNGKVFVNGQPTQDFENTNLESKQQIIIKIEGNVEKIESATEVHVTGNVEGDILRCGSVNIQKDCLGDIDATANVSINGNCKSIETTGNVTVGGNCHDIDTDGNVTVRGNCAGDIDTLGSVHVGSNNKKW